jgi:hypothetical protein
VESGRSEAIKPFPKTGYRLSFSDQRRLNVFASQNAKQWGRFLGGWWQEGQKRDPGGASMGILRCEDSAQNDLVCDHRIKEARGDLGRLGVGPLEREVREDMGRNHWVGKGQGRIVGARGIRSGFGERGLCRDPAGGAFLPRRNRDPRIEQIGGGACPRGPGMVPSGIQNFLYKERVRGNDCPWLARDGSPEA